MRKILIPLVLVALLLPACNPLSKLGQDAVKQNRENVAWMSTELTRYLDKDEKEDKDTLDDVRLGIKKAMSLALKIEKQVKEDK